MDPEHSRAGNEFGNGNLRPPRQMQAVEKAYTSLQRLLIRPGVEGRLFVDNEHRQTGHSRAESRRDALGQGPVHRVPGQRLDIRLRSRVYAGRVCCGGGVNLRVHFAHARLATVSYRVEHVGPLGAGARMKACRNLLLAVFGARRASSLLLVDPSGHGCRTRR